MFICCGRSEVPSRGDLDDMFRPWEATSMDRDKLRKESVSRVREDSYWSISYVSFISVFGILGHTSYKRGAVGTVGIRVKINVYGSTTEDGCFVQPNVHLLGHTAPWLMCVFVTAEKSCCQHFLVLFLPISRVEQAAAMSVVYTELCHWGCRLKNCSALSEILEQSSSDEGKERG